MGNKIDSKERDASGIFLVIDEFAALKLHWIRKNLQEINDSLRRIMMMGRAANIHIGYNVRKHQY